MLESGGLRVQFLSLSLEGSCGFHKSIHAAHHGSLNSLLTYTDFKSQGENPSSFEERHLIPLVFIAKKLFFS